MAVTVGGRRPRHRREGRRRRAHSCLPPSRHLRPQEPWRPLPPTPRAGVPTRGAAQLVTVAAQERARRRGLGASPGTGRGGAPSAGLPSLGRKLAAFRLPRQGVQSEVSLDGQMAAGFLLSVDVATYRPQGAAGRDRNSQWKDRADSVPASPPLPAPRPHHAGLRGPKAPGATRLWAGGANAPPGGLPVCRLPPPALSCFILFNNKGFLWFWLSIQDGENTGLGQQQVDAVQPSPGSWSRASG